MFATSGRLEKALPGSSFLNVEVGLSQELSFGELVVRQSSKDHITIWEASILEKGAFRAWVPDSRSSIGNRNTSIKIDGFIK